MLESIPSLNKSLEILYTMQYTITKQKFSATILTISCNGEHGLRIHANVCSHRIAIALYALQLFR